MPVVDFVSPHIRLTDWQDGKKSDIDVFEDQIQGWVFDQTDLLLDLPPDRRQHSSHALLALTTPYFEMISCYIEGRRPGHKESSSFLRRGLQTVLGANASAEAIREYVSEVRNGIGHELMFRFVSLHENANSPQFGLVDGPFGPILSVNPFWLNKITQDHFREYTARLRTPSTAEDQQRRQDFDAFMTVRKTVPTSRRPTAPGETPGKPPSPRGDQHRRSE